MKAKVLTRQGQGAQVVEVTSDDLRQIALVAFRGEPIRQSIVWSHAPGAVEITIAEAVLEAARVALREHEAHALYVLGGRMRRVLLNERSVEGSSMTELVLSPGGRRISCEFTHRTLETGPERYELVLRRKRV